MGTIREIKDTNCDTVDGWGRKLIPAIKYLIDFDEPIRVENRLTTHKSFHFSYGDIMKFNDKGDV
jgi:hypothetical protein